MDGTVCCRHNSTVLQNNNQKKTKKPTMKGTWTKWAMEYHSFSDVTFDLETYNKFSGAVKEFVDEVDGMYVLMSLKYAFPAVSKPGDPAKPLSSDQKLKNTLFLREVGKIWASAKEELRLRVLESISRSETSTKGGGGGNRRGASVHAIERNCLNALSIKRMKQWVEDDEDKRVEELKEVASEKANQAKISHDQFVRHKDR
jgi:hypothetical protein